jgi:hypothetical protein
MGRKENRAIARAQKKGRLPNEAEKAVIELQQKISEATSLYSMLETAIQWCEKAPESDACSERDIQLRDRLDTVAESISGMMEELIDDIDDLKEAQAKRAASPIVLPDEAAILTPKGEAVAS